MIQRNERQDSYLHKGLRRKLVDDLRAKGIKDEKVLQAMMDTPRHFFLDPAFEHIAYQDRAFPIAAAQTISHPYTVAYQTELLQPQPFEKILEIGTGSAYQSCILARLGAFVYNHNTAFLQLFAKLWGDKRRGRRNDKLVKRRVSR